MTATHHELAASVATCHWGSFDAAPGAGPDHPAGRSGDGAHRHGGARGPPRRRLSCAAGAARHPSRAAPRAGTSPHRPDPDRRGPAGRRARGPHPGGATPAGLGLHPGSPAVGHAAGGFPGAAADPHRARCGADGRAAALGHRAAAQALLRRHGRRPAGRLGPAQHHPAAGAWRQSRQQGAGRGDHALSASVARGRSVLGRRRPRRSGRRRGLRDRDRDRAQRHLRVPSCGAIWAACASRRPRRRMPTSPWPRTPIWTTPPRTRSGT